jgi:hypothetical protein
MKINAWMSRLAFGLVVSGLTLASGRASSIAITNAGFEDPALAFGNFVQGSATGWVGNGPFGTWYPTTIANNGSGLFMGVPEGNQILVVSYGDPSDVNQALGVTLQADTTYTLSYYVGRRIDIGLSQYSVSLRTNSSVLASDSGGSPDAGSFVLRTFSFTTGAAPADFGQQLSIDIQATGLTAPSGAQAQAGFDLFTLDASTASSSSTPEPASWILIFSGIAGAAIRCRAAKHRA